MKFTQFKIKNFKGIEDITFNLDKSPEANIFTLVGLNESGKTTILEAMNLFNPSNHGIVENDVKDSAIDFNDLIPISKRDNFNDTIEIIVSLKLEKDDWDKIDDFIKTQTQFKYLQKRDTISYFRYYRYEKSKFKQLESKWSSFYGVLKTEESDKLEYIDHKNYSKENIELVAICSKMIPGILYFPNFLFDFPSRIYLETTEKPTKKENFYLELIQDILNSLGNDTNVKEHLVDRIQSEDVGDKKSLSRLIQLMENKVTEIIFHAWNKIFKRQIKETSIKIGHNINGENLSYLEFEIVAEDGIYQLHDRSLGFRWFFIFLLFTQFRPFRKDSPQNIIFLFDEPASNLHSSAQQQLLKSFENLTGNSKVIYTTHSHHLINPNWLESTYVVKNEGFKLEDPETYSIKKTKITIQPYREFVTKHPHHTAYFQPILDVLDYAPSNLEHVPNCIFLEGKNDYYTLAYFNEVIFKNMYKLNMAPSSGASNMDTLISLYIGWGKDFVILLDSDNEGNSQKSRYLEKFGIILEHRLYTLVDIKSEWDKCSTESLFRNNDALKFQFEKYPNSDKFNKTHFNRAVQENLINKTEFEFSEETQSNFEAVLNFLEKKIVG